MNETNLFNPFAINVSVTEKLGDQSTILFIIFGNFTKFWCNFRSPQVKRNLISSIMNVTYELPNN